ncbi:MAG: hypothetical protein WDZ82_00090 [Candidatus Paceibacterota bacterium]
MFSFFSKNDTQTHFLIECGSGSAACALIVTDADRKPKIVYQKRIPFETQENKDHRGTVSSLTKTLAQLLKEVRSTGFEKLTRLDAPRKLSDITVTFTAPWYAVRTPHISQDYKEERVITDDFLTGLKEQEKQKMVVNGASLFSDEFQNESPIIVESIILQSKLNGYTTENPVNKRTTSFEAQLYVSAVQQSVLDKIESLIGETFDISNVSYHTLPLITFFALRDLFTTTSNALFVDISGEATTISAVHDGSIRDVLSFTKGTHGLVHHVADTLHIGTKAAASALAMHDLSVLNPSTHSNINEYIQKYTHEWFTDFSNTVDTIKEKHHVGNRVVIVAGVGLTDYFHDQLTKQNAGSENAKHQVIELKAGQLARRLRFPKTFQPDSFIALEAIVLADNEL